MMFMRSNTNSSDSKQIFEAAITVVREGSDSQASEPANAILRRRRPIRMNAEGPEMNQKRALGEAVDALTALWGLRGSRA